MIHCRNCGRYIPRAFMNYGRLPLPNSFIDPCSPQRVKRYPLTLYFCRDCSLVQLKNGIPPREIFGDDYKYFSSYSDALLERSKEYYENITKELGLRRDSKIIEIASNDGYLLGFFKEGGYTDIMGIEPTLSTAVKAMEKGIPTEVRFFDEKYAEILSRTKKADLLIANNVIAHVPDINGFVKGISLLLDDDGCATVEFQYIKDLILHQKFDLVYHEHYSYFSLKAASYLMDRNGLKIWRVEKTDSQGGSLRIYCAHKTNSRAVEDSYHEYLAEEKDAGMYKRKLYGHFAGHTRSYRKRCIRYLLDLKKDGARIAAYGASAKGSMFLNYLGIGGSIIDFIADRNENKQGLVAAGTGIPVYGPEKIALYKPDYILILSWNIKEEIMAQNTEVQKWNGRFFVLVPEPVMLDQV